MPIVKVQPNSGGGLDFRDACVRFSLLHQKAGNMRDFFIFIIISVCGSSKVIKQRAKYLFSPHSDLSFLLVSG